jgi:anti-sigma regulatory factor (Ser/Thr protein kinase)
MALARHRVGVARPVAARQKGCPTDRARSRRFARDPAEIARARAFVRDSLRAWDLDGDVMLFELAVSELMTNAITHGAGDVNVTIRGTEDLVRMEVTDGGGGSGPVSPVEPGSSPGLGGWGLRIVEGLSESWGTRRDAKGTLVWVERRVREAPG